MTLISIQDGPRSYLGIKTGAKAVSADLGGFGGDLDLHVWDGELELNRVKGASTKLDWDSLSVEPGNITLPSLEVDEGRALHVAGGLVLNAASGAVVAKANLVGVDFGTASGSDQAAVTPVSFTNADVVAVTLTGSRTLGGPGRVPDRQSWRNGDARRLPGRPGGSR